MLNNSKLSNTVAESLLKKQKLEAEITDLEKGIIDLEPIHKRYVDRLLYGIKKEEAIKLEANKLKRHFGKPTLSLEDVSTYLGVDILKLEMLFLEKALPFTYVYFPTFEDDIDVFCVPIESFAEYIVNHTVK